MNHCVFWIGTKIWRKIQSCCFQKMSEQEQLCVTLAIETRDASVQNHYYFIFTPYFVREEPTKIGLPLSFGPSRILLVRRPIPFDRHPAPTRPFPPHNQICTVCGANLASIKGRSSPTIRISTTCKTHTSQDPSRRQREVPHTT